MFENITKVHGKILDEILKARHTVRKFKSIQLNKVAIENIIRAGTTAPFASFPAAGKTDFRRFFIISAGSSSMQQIKNIINDRLPKFADEVEKKFGLVAFVKVTKEVGTKFIVQLLNSIPCLIIAGERKGIPEIASESLSYCMQNMWLKATSLKIGYEPITYIAHLRLGNDDEFCRLLDISCGEFTLDGCALGYPSDDYQPFNINYPDFDSNVKWLK